LARLRGAEWLHVDFDSRLEPFYRKAGYQDTRAGLLRLRTTAAALSNTQMEPSRSPSYVIMSPWRLIWTVMRPTSAEASRNQKRVLPSSDTALNKGGQNVDHQR
jgi:hypothetical protein